MPPGSGLRVGVDRDEDGWFDRDEIDAGTDPADPSDFPAGTTTTTSTIIGPPTTTTTTVPYFLIRGKLTLRDDNTAPINPDKRKIAFVANTKKEIEFTNKVGVPSPDNVASPVSNGATLVVYNSSPAANAPLDQVTLDLPPSRWTSNPQVFGSYTYSDPSDTAKVKIVYRIDKLVIKVRGPAWPYTLDESQQGSVAVRFATNVGGYQFCSDVPAKVRGGSTAKTDTIDKFTGETKVPPLACPPLKNASPSGAFLDPMDAG